MLGVRPTDAGFVVDTSVQYVDGERPCPGEPLFIASLLISVECHLPDTCGPAALAKVVPESWVQPRGQAAGANRLAAGLRILGPARLRLDLVELLEQRSEERRVGKECR